MSAASPRLPDSFIIGADKAGTTTRFDLLRRHYADEMKQLEGLIARDLLAASEKEVRYSSNDERHARGAGYPPLAPEDQQRLRTQFADEVLACQALIGRDLAHWLPS